MLNSEKKLPDLEVVVPPQNKCINFTVVTPKSETSIARLAEENFQKNFVISNNQLNFLIIRFFISTLTRLITDFMLNELQYTKLLI